MEIQQGLYAQVVMICQKDLKITEANGNKLKINSSSMISVQDHSVGSILIFIVLKKSLAHVNLVSMKKSIKFMMEYKIKQI